MPLHNLRKCKRGTKSSSSEDEESRHARFRGLLAFLLSEWVSNHALLEYVWAK